MDETNQQQRKSPYAVAFAIVGELALEIAVPVVVLAVLGKFLDLRYQTGHTLLISGFVVAFIMSSMIIYRRAQIMKRMYENEKDL